MPCGRWGGLAESLAMAGMTVLACHHANAPPPGRAEAGAIDTIAGTVRVVGVAALPRIVMVPDYGGATLTLRGSPSLARVSGLRILAVGWAAGPQFTVARFTVVGANGVAASDGRLAADGKTLYLVTADGVPHPLVRPSAALWAHVGDRVWVSGPLDHEPVAYGIIE
jgi:hypothetical protein